MAMLTGQPRDAGLVGAHQAALRLEQRVLDAGSRRFTSSKLQARSRGSCSCAGVRACGIIRIVFFLLRSLHAGHAATWLPQRDAAALVEALGRLALRRACSAAGGTSGRRSRPGGRRSPGRRRRRTSRRSPTFTRQPPHMPVPSTITGFRLTIVRMLVRPRRLRAALHHHRRADGDALVDVRVLRDRPAGCPR